ncbi:aldo/keto reductase family protein [Micromonospora sp. NPDC005174]|uniref:aldo/keto reductase family protein n=1 Tax=Micromonospora sp. NPDC005174 TaxID=3157018 RepID=UPI0033A9DAD8
MEFRPLGRSGLRVSEIAYGNWLTHGSQIDVDTARTCVTAALGEGITTFDTADVYAGTRAEAVLGEALTGVRRESLVLCTKVYFPTGPGPNDQGLSRKHIVESLHASLRRLRTDYVDVYYAHRFDHATPLVETLRAFDDLVRQGKVLYLGVSEWTAEQIVTARRLAEDLGLTAFVANQPQYNMLWRVIEGEVVPACEKAGMSQVVFSPLAQGVLSGKYRSDGPAPEGSRALDANGADWVGPYLRPEVLERVAALRPLAAEAGLTTAQLAVAWTLNNPNVAAAVIGASRPEQIRENVAAVGVRLDPSLLRRIDETLGDVVERDPGRTESAV